MSQGGKEGDFIFVSQLEKGAGCGLFLVRDRGHDFAVGVVVGVRVSYFVLGFGYFSVYSVGNVPGDLGPLGKKMDCRITPLPETMSLS